MKSATFRNSNESLYFVVRPHLMKLYEHENTSKQSEKKKKKNLNNFKLSTRKTEINKDEKI